MDKFEILRQNISWVTERTQKNTIKSAGLHLGFQNATTKRVKLRERIS